MNYFPCSYNIHNLIHQSTKFTNVTYNTFKFNFVSFIIPNYYNLTNDTVCKKGKGLALQPQDGP